MNVSKPITNGAERDGDVMRSHLRAEPIINAKRDTPYNMKTQKEIGLLGEKVCRNFLIDCCAKHRFGFVRFEDVRDVKMYQERDIDFIVYTSSGKTITLDAKADTYTTGNIFLEIYVPGFKLGKNGVPIAKYTENGERAGQKPGWLFRGADFIFYCFLNTKEIFVFDRECAAYYACECAMSGMPLIPIYRTAKNDENRGDNRNYYGMGICPNALRMMNSNIMRNHMWLCHFQKGPYYNPYTKIYDHPKKSA